MKKIFVTGTGTDVGKTYVTALIIKKLNQENLNPAYFKAAMSGNERDSSGKLIPGDATHVKKISGIRQPLEEMCPYVYENALSPHLASRLEGNPVKLKGVKENFEKITGKYDFITIEGSGGIVCPLNFDGEEIYLSDVIKLLECDCILVADAGLGTINNVVLTAEYMKSRNLKIRGMIFNNYIPGNVMHEDNIKMCHHLTKIPVLAKVQKNSHELEIDISQLTAIYS